VATWFEGSEGRRVDVPADVVVSVLAELGVTATTPEAVRAALAEVRRDELPPTIVLRTGQARSLGAPATIRTEDGRTVDVGDEIPGDLPLGGTR